MAARENQTLQIALIIFVIITVLMIVATFLLFNNYTEAQERIKSLVQENQQKDTATRNAVGESDQVKGFLDPDLSKLEDLEAAAKKDFDAHGKNLAEADRNYRGLVAEMAKELAEANTRITEVSAHEKELVDKLAAEQDSTKQLIAEYQQTKDKITKDLEEQRAQFDQFREQMNADKAELNSKFDEKARSFDELTKSSRAQIAGLESNVGDLQRLLEARSAQEAEQQRANEMPDGKVAWVNQRTRTVWINLGSEDGLRRQTSFSVFPQDAANPRDSKQKGMVEVVQLKGPHMAEARILEDDVSDPLMPGDKIFSPSWEPGVPVHFALAGVMDIDGDGADDRQRVRDLIVRNGGLIDEELNSEGKRDGKMSIRTKYLVLGDPPPASENSGAIRGWSEIHDEARVLGTRTIKVAEFLDYVGYSPQQRTVRLDSAARGSDFKPRLPGGVQRIMPENKSLRDIRPPAPTRELFK